jgi:hypothetical protein
MSEIWTGWRVIRHPPLDGLPLCGSAYGERWATHLLGKIVEARRWKASVCLVVLEDGAGVSPGELAGTRHDGLEHRIGDRASS